MTKLKLVGAFATAAMMLASTSAMAVTIGFSQVGSEGDWRPAFSKNMQDSASEYGIDLKFADAQGKQEEQLRAVRAFIAQGVDAIIIAPVVVTGWDQVLQEAKRSNIPVFLVDRDVEVEDDSLYVTRISADFNLEGKLAAAWLAAESLGSCKVVELQGTVGSAAAIGNTPLIRLNRASELTGCEIWGKAEFLNPGQSIKDRAALFIIRDAERRGLLQPGGTIVEGTAGNTGIGLTVVGNALGYKSVIVIPETQSQEKKDTLRLYGAELIEVPAVPYKNPNNYVKVSGRLAEKLTAEREGGAIWANQFDNVANRQAHIEGTAQEILRQTDGKLDGFISAVGTGGTLGGMSLGLKEADKNIQIGLADPEGAALYSYYTTGELKSEGGSITEGIGQGRITANLEDVVVDHAFRIPDSEALPQVFDLIEHEGLCLGGSSGINIAGAIRLARELGPGKTIVTVLCDYGHRYQSKLFNPDFLRSKDLPVPGWLERPPSVDVKSVFTEV